MLSEGFLSVLLYRDEQKAPSTAKLRGKGHTDTRPQHGRPSLSDAGERSQMVLLHTDPYMAEPCKGRERLREREPENGFSTPGSSLTHCPHRSADLNCECSLIQQYPDLRLRQELDKATSPHSTASYHSLSVPLPVSGLPLHALQSIPCSQGPERQPGTEVLDQTYPVKPGTSIPDQGYLVMGSSPSLDVQLLGLEPMSNSLLNGLLEKQLDEVYRQYLTDSLARCNSQLGQSLLHGLVPLPQPGGEAQASDSLEVSLEGVPSKDRSSLISYLNTNSHFSSPVLRISDAESVQ